MLEQGWTPVVERLARGRCVVRRAILPTPREDADPCECQGAHGGLVGFALVALLLGEDACPEGMPDRCSRPLHARVAEDRRTLEAPVHPGWLAAACGDRGDARLCLPCGGRGRAVALLAEGDEEAGGPDRPSAWEGLAEGKVGRRWACGAMAVSTSAMAGTVTRRWATRAWTRRALGVLTPASRVRGVADLMAWRRWAMISAERT